MHALFTDLADILRKEIEHYRRLLALVHRERGRIVKGELAGLTELVRNKEVLTLELAQLGESRASLLDRLGEALGAHGALLTLAQVARLAPPEAGDAMNALLTEFRGVIGRLVAANEVNRTLLDRSLEFVQGSLALFRTVVAVNPTYDAGGRLAPSDSTLLALNRMA